MNIWIKWGIIKKIIFILECDNIPNFEYVCICLSACVKSYLSIEIPEFNEIIYIVQREWFFKNSRLLSLWQ